MIVQSVAMLVLIRRLAHAHDIITSPNALRRAVLLLRLFMWIIIIHLIQVGLWAVVFWRGRELPDLETAVYFSLVSYTTIGFGDVVLSPGWRLLAGLEGLAGIILIGWSTAFMITVVNRMYEHWRQVHGAL